MKTITVNKYSEVPFIGIQVFNIKDSYTAFNYAIDEYSHYGYDVAYYSIDINCLFIGKLK